MEPGRGELPHGQLLRQGAIKHPAANKLCLEKDGAGPGNPWGCCAPRAHRSLGGCTHTCCTWLGKDEHGHPQEGWTSQRGHPQEGGSLCWHPSGLAAGQGHLGFPWQHLLHHRSWKGSVCVSHRIVHTAQRVPDPRDVAPLLRAALLSVVPTNEGYHPRVEMMDTSPSGLGAAHPPALSIWQRVKV